MNKNDILKVIGDEFENVAKDEMKKALKAIDLRDLRPIIQEHVDTLTKPLDDEADKTDSLWVKIRNRVYVRLINAMVDTITNAAKAELDRVVNK